MVRHAAASLAAGSPVLLDATFLDGGRREEVAALAAAHGVPFVLVETTCDDAEVRRRLRERAATGSDPSDASIGIYDRQRHQVDVEPPLLPEGAIHVAIDTTDPDAAPLAPLLDALARSGIVTPRIPEQPLLMRE
jgi:predicted kinase